MTLASASVAISEVRDQLYPSGSKGDWTRAYYLASRLARIGLVNFIDRFNIERSGEAYNAISSIDDPLYVVDQLRLD
jgi:hypothetical protein